jgi:hypothetical protein
MPSKIKSLITTLVFLLSCFAYANAAEINTPGFSGTVNTTATTGLSLRIDRNCLSVRGQQNTDATYQAWVAANIATADQTAFYQNQAPEGCAARYTDGYGNVGNDPRNLISENADDGNMNIDGGEIFDQTTRVYSEITGMTDSGVGINLSLVGSYNAVDSFSTDDFAPFTNEELSDIESNIDLLNAYATYDVDDLSVTAGRFVTNWGESTFIPIGMNGLTTNALDLVSLRKPGASIKEALVPTEQLTISGYLDGGWSFEAYYQLGESHVNFDEAGTFFGNEIVKNKNLVVAGNFGSPASGYSQSAGCAYHLVITEGLSCEASTVAVANSTTGRQASSTYYYQEGFKNFFGSDNAGALIAKAAVLGTGAPSTFGGSAGDIEVLGLSSPTAVAAAYAAMDEYTKKGGDSAFKKLGTVDIVGNGHTYADGDDQYGFALRTYLDNVGTGVDLGIYFAQYDSKVPYLRFKGQQGLIAGDMFGAYQLAAATGGTLTAYLSNAGSMEGTGSVTLDGTETAGKTQIGAGLFDVAYAEGACSAYQQGVLANAMYELGSVSSSAYTSEQKSNALKANYTNIGGKLYHDSSKCFANSSTYSTAATQLAAAALLGGALAPLNNAEYEFIYPENIQAMGISANTNIGGMTVQAEVTYRPDFPLATAIADQANQLGDSVGTTALLSLAVAQNIFGSDPDFTATMAQYNANVDSEAGITDMMTSIKSFNRSYLPRISLSTIAAGDFYTTPYLEYDVWSGTVGTTSSFTASHPVTAGLGADSAVFLTELGFVHIVDLPSNTGFVNRGGYRDGVGGEKCGGVTQAGTSFNSVKALDGLTHLGSSQTDPLFGNGSYCESKNGADETAFTYRLIGSATYNNFQNTAWSFSPSFVWSHDPSGYGPTSLGGFVEGRQSLSLSGNFSKGDTSIGMSYVNQLGDELDNTSYDRDYISANVSYAF